MGFWDTLKSTGKTIFNTLKQPVKMIWSGIKQVDDKLMNPVVQTGISLAQPELSPFFAGYDVGKYVLDKLGGGFISKQLDNL